jgi:hypothetical protein
MASTKWLLSHQKLSVAHDFSPIQWPKITLGGLRPCFLIEKILNFAKMKNTADKLKKPESTRMARSCPRAVLVELYGPCKLFAYMQYTSNADSPTQSTNT